MTDRRRYYNKELSKRIVVNLTKEDYERWKAAADLEGRPVATMIRGLVEIHICDIELAEEHDIKDILAYCCRLMIRIYRIEVARFITPIKCATSNPRYTIIGHRFIVNVVA